MSAVTQVVERLHLLDDFSARPQLRERWAELCRSVAAAVAFLCLTSSAAAVILMFLERT